MPTKNERDAVRTYLDQWTAKPDDFPERAILDAYDQIDRLEVEVERLLAEDESHVLPECVAALREAVGSPEGESVPEDFEHAIIHIRKIRAEVERLRGIVSGLTPEEIKQALVRRARRARCCRICGNPDSFVPPDSLRLDYGKEYAHQSCLDKLAKEADL